MGDLSYGPFMLMLWLALSIGAEPLAPNPQESTVEKPLRMVLNAGGPAFDACMNRYLHEYPEVKGSVKLELGVASDGQVRQAKAETSLVGARNLRPCLESVAKNLHFPKHRGDQLGQLSVTIPIEKGARFRLWAPGEEPPPGKPHQKRTMVRFLPGDWSVVGPSAE